MAKTTGWGYRRILGELKKLCIGIMTDLPPPAPTEHFELADIVCHESLGGLLTSEELAQLWLQGWLVAQRRIGRVVESVGETVTLYIPTTDTLATVLNGPLKVIARWADESQMVLSLNVAIAGQAL